MWVQKQHPVLAEILGQVALCQSPASVLRTTRLQRLWNAGAGKDWAALPHTVGFVDPLHSTGIAHTLSGVTRLAEAMLATDRRDTAAKLEEYSRSVVHEIRHIDRLVAGCYLGLDDFRLFSTWSMLYFAAATLQEQQTHVATRLSSNFLGANDPAFVGIVTNLLARLQTMITSHSSLDEQQLEAFRQACRSAIHPYNRVGLFAPDLPNIYRHTSAEKHHRTSNDKSDAQPFPSS
jgi:FADH2 O2-dependent halogenase